jgi:hypothetical protein
MNNNIMNYNRTQTYHLKASRQMLRWFPSSKLLLHAFHAALPMWINQNFPLDVGSLNYLIFFQITSAISFENQIPRSLSQGCIAHSKNVFSLILSLSEGRAGIAWVTSNKMLFCPPYTYKAPLASSPPLPHIIFISDLVISVLTLFETEGVHGAKRTVQRVWSLLVASEYR